MHWNYSSFVRLVGDTVPLSYIVMAVLGSLYEVWDIIRSSSTVCKNTIFPLYATMLSQMILQNIVLHHVVITQSSQTRSCGPCPPMHRYMFTHIHVFAYVSLLPWVVIRPLRKRFILLSVLGRVMSCNAPLELTSIFPFPRSIYQREACPWRLLEWSERIVSPWLSL